jgi:hypothetical protein
MGDTLRMYLWQTFPARMDPTWAIAMFICALPFLWLGVMLTLGRLRSAGLSLWWVLLFFVPAAIVAVWYGGMLPGLIAAMAGLMLGEALHELGGYEEAESVLHDTEARVTPDDPLFPVNFGLIEAWRKAKRPVEFHYYEQGGHGFGMYPKETTSTGWFNAFVSWLTMHGMVKPQA